MMFAVQLKPLEIVCDEQEDQDGHVAFGRVAEGRTTSQRQDT
jgi:hypothetical protein